MEILLEWGDVRQNVILKRGRPRVKSGGRQVERVVWVEILFQPIPTLGSLCRLDACFRWRFGNFFLASIVWF